MAPATLKVLWALTRPNMHQASLMTPFCVITSYPQAIEHSRSCPEVADLDGVSRGEKRWVAGMA